MKSKLALGSLGLTLLPLVAFAQQAGPNTHYVDAWIETATRWLNIAITVIMVLMTLIFLWQVLRFILNKDSAKATEYKNNMLRGLIGLFVAVAVWGIIQLAANIFNVQTGNRNTDVNSAVTCPPGFFFRAGAGCVQQ